MTKTYNIVTNMNNWAKLKILPIKKLSDQKPFVEIIDKILTITNSSDYSSSSEKQEKARYYKKQIDQLVYKL